MQPLYRDMKKTYNIEAYVEWFNRLSYLVATEICVVRDGGAVWCRDNYAYI